MRFNFEIKFQTELEEKYLHIRLRATKQACKILILMYIADGKFILISNVVR